MIVTKEDLKRYNEADRVALRVPKQTLLRRIINLFFPLVIWEFEKTLRLAEYYNNKKSVNSVFCVYDTVLKFYYKYRLRKKSIKLGFDIPINVFGPGLSIAHYGTIIVNGKARIGANCRIHASVNIGASAGVKKAPQIGDNCYIGPGAILFGDIKIANRVTIGANATVNKSCEIENVVLAGTPAKIVKEHCPDWTQFNGLSK